MKDEPEEVYNYDAYNQLNYAAHWLTSTGTHYSFLRKVVLNVVQCVPLRVATLRGFEKFSLSFA